MRDLKFRMYALDIQKMFEMDRLHLPCTTNPNTASVYMQYTGLKDKNGKEIYESDVIKVFPFDGCSHIEKATLFEIKFDNARFIAKGINYGNSQLHLDFYSNHCDVIGNIYENADLVSQT